MSLKNEFNVSVISLAWRVMAQKLTRFTRHDIGYILYCLPCFVVLKISGKVQVGNDQEKAQSEKDSHSINQGGKKLN